MGEGIWVYSGGIHVSLVFILFLIGEVTMKKEFSKLNSNQPLGPIIGIFCTEYYVLQISFLIWEGEEYSIHDKTGSILIVRNVHGDKRLNTLVHMTAKKKQLNLVNV